jgi:hypothetical protein
MTEGASAHVSAFQSEESSRNWRGGISCESARPR